MLTFIDMQILRDLKLNANRNKLRILFLVTNLLDNIMGFKTVAFNQYYINIYTFMFNHATIKTPK